MTQHNGQTTALNAETDSLLSDDLLTFDELAAKLKIGRQTVPRLLRRYKIPVTKLAPNTQRVTREQYRRLIAECTVVRGQEREYRPRPSHRRRGG